MLCFLWILFASLIRMTYRKIIIIIIIIYLLQLGLHPVAVVLPYYRQKRYSSTTQYNKTLRMNLNEIFGGTIAKKVVGTSRRLR
jgi:hypothetical protein